MARRPVKLRPAGTGASASDTASDAALDAALDAASPQTHTHALGTSSHKPVPELPACVRTEHGWAGRDSAGRVCCGGRVAMARPRSCGTKDSTVPTEPRDARPRRQGCLRVSRQWARAVLAQFDDQTGDTPRTQPMAKTRLQHQTACRTFCAEHAVRIRRLPPFWPCNMRSAWGIPGTYPNVPSGRSFRIRPPISTAANHLSKTPWLACGFRGGCVPLPCFFIQPLATSCL